MNQNRKEELLTRWMDDALSDEELRELAPILAAEPELEREREQFLELRAKLQAALPAEVEPPYPDFFNSHLERHIEGLARSGPIGQGKGRLGFSRIWMWLMAPAATAALVVAFVAGMKSVSQDGQAVIAAAGSDVYSPLTNVTTEVVLRDEALGATVIVVDGLEELDDQDLAIGSGSLGGSHGVFVNAEPVY